jgi:hypothetical protein
LKVGGVEKVDVLGYLIRRLEELAAATGKELKARRRSPRRLRPPQPRRRQQLGKN